MPKPQHSEAQKIQISLECALNRCTIEGMTRILADIQIVATNVINRMSKREYSRWARFSVFR